MTDLSTTRLRSFGRRRTGKLRPRQEALAEGLLPRLRIALPEDAAERLDPKELFVPNVQQVWLEIGFGGGEHLAAQAQRHPEIGMIGCEPFVDGVVKLLAAVEEHALRNVRILDEDARLLLDCLEAGSLDRVFILFPDPWPKQRHHKRRIINPETLDLLAAVLKPGGMLCLATDHVEYAEWMLAHLLADRRFVWTARSPEDSFAPPEGWVETRYQAKTTAEGRKPRFLIFSRSAG